MLNFHLIAILDVIKLISYTDGRIQMHGQNLIIKELCNQIEIMKAVNEKMYIE